jgi:steroid delta-isomerase
MSDEAAIRVTLDTYWATMSAGDRAGWLACFAPDATVEDPVGTAVRKGHDEIGAFFDETQGMADSIELRPVGITNVCGREVAFAMEIRPTIGGSVFTMNAIDVMTFDDRARIASMRAFWDASTMRPADA